MTRNYRKPNHQRANSEVSLRRCHECHRKLRTREFVEVRRVKRTIFAFAYRLQGPGWREKTVVHKTCRVCRSHVWWHKTTAVLRNRRWAGSRTPLVQVGGRFLFG